MITNMVATDKETENKLTALEEHLREENPFLVEPARSFRRLDKIGHKMGLLSRKQSYSSQIAWWPLISILGTYSAGKSTFINHYLRHTLQNTGAQAVDDKFTVICYSRDQKARTLPGIALNADPRFPFYKMSEELDKVKPGEGGRIDVYLQLKTCPSDYLRGAIIIDSPGFDADAQRTSVLKITDYIIDLSDLVLVMFDARHPEPGTMQDTLTHLVTNTVGRKDANKFIYILNQIDTTARENNPEDVVGAWHRAIAQEGLTAGRFYCIYSPDAAIPIEDEALRNRFETKRDKDLAEIHDRIRHVSLERAYRIVGALEKTARKIDEKHTPKLRELIGRWRRGVLLRDGVMYGAICVCLAALAAWLRLWEPERLHEVLPEAVVSGGWAKPTAVVLVAAVGVWLHFLSRKWSAKSVVAHIKASIPLEVEQESMTRAFLRNVRFWRSIFCRNPVGWGQRTGKQLQAVINDTGKYIQSLNDQFAVPSGERNNRGGAFRVFAADDEARPFNDNSPLMGAGGEASLHGKTGDKN